MKKHFAMTKAQRQTEWLSKFSDIVLTIDEKYSGKIEWPSALHFMHQGMTPEDAGKLYTDNRK